jgi:hypothetical protein
MLAARLGESGFNVLDVPHGYLDERGCRLEGIVTVEVTNKFLEAKAA